MKPQDGQRVAADEAPMPRARLAVVLPGHPIGALAVEGEALSLAARTDEAAHQAAARPV